MNRRKPTRWELALFATPMFFVLAAVLSGEEPLSWRFHFLDKEAQRQGNLCYYNLRCIGIAMLQYELDNERRFPPASIGGSKGRVGVAPFNPPVGWVDAVYPYLKNSLIYECPSALPTDMSPLSVNATNYWLNGKLSTLRATKVKRPAATLLAGDGNDGRETADGTYSKTALPPQWTGDFTSPAYRHLGGANYAFVDGHVAWLRPNEISSAPDVAYTFATK